MSEQKFVVGDVVKLKSGGPAITVTKVFQDNEGTWLVSCSWITDAGQALMVNYPFAALVKS